MGYYTAWSMWPLEVNRPDEHWYFEQAVEYLRKESEEAKYALEPDGSYCQEAKWYEWAVDMKAMSERFPDMVFVLQAHGEDDDGWWMEYWKGGKVQHEDAVITYGEYDERKLK